MNFEILFSPLRNFGEAFSLMYLVLEIKDKNRFENITKSFNKLFDSNLSIENVKCCIQKFKHNSLNFDADNFSETYNKLKIIKEDMKEIVRPPISKCLNCDNTLSKTGSSDIITFTLQKIVINEVENFQCYKCLNSYSADFYTQNDTKYLYPSNVETSIVQTSSQTAFDTFLLNTFDYLLFRSGVSFEGFCDYFNAVFPNNKIKRNLDRRRLSEAYFTYKIRNFCF